MIDWLADNATLAMTILGVAFLALLFLWWQRRTRPLLIATACVAAAMLLVLGLARFVETDRKKLSKTLQQMVEALNARRYDDVMKHVAKTVRTETGAGFIKVDKEALHQAAQRYMNNEPNIRMRYWNLKFEKLDPPNAHLTCFFARDDDDAFAIGDMEFTLTDGEWLLTGFTVYRGLGNGPKTRIDLPIR